MNGKLLHVMQNGINCCKLLLAISQPFDSHVNAQTLQPKTDTKDLRSQSKG